MKLVILTLALTLPLSAVAEELKSSKLRKIVCEDFRDSDYMNAETFDIKDCVTAAKITVSKWRSEFQAYGTTKPSFLPT